MATIYYPYFGKLMDGSYTAHDLELTWTYVTPPDKLFRQVIESSAYDVAEMSMSGYTMLRSKGWREYIALPIFTSRRFRHSALFVRADSDIISGAQLAGKKVGLPEYHMTAAVWVRGFLEEDFGVKPGDVQWREAAWTRGTAATAQGGSGSRHTDSIERNLVQYASGWSPGRRDVRS